MLLPSIRVSALGRSYSAKHILSHITLHILFIFIMIIRRLWIKWKRPNRLIRIIYSDHTKHRETLGTRDGSLQMLLA